jgi:uncharacterized membrane protein YgcG
VEAVVVEATVAGVEAVVVAVEEDVAGNVLFCFCQETASSNCLSTFQSVICIMAYCSEALVSSLRTVVITAVAFTPVHVSVSSMLCSVAPKLNAVNHCSVLAKQPLFLVNVAIVSIQECNTDAVQRKRSRGSYGGGDRDGGRGGGRGGGGGGKCYAYQEGNVSTAPLSQQLN